MSTLTVVVAAKRIEADGIASFDLRSPSGEALPVFSAGAHIDVHLPGDLTRQYSLCNDPAQSDRYLIGVLRDPKSRGGSIALHDRVEKGAELRISAPRCTFPMTPADHSILIAGGIGVTPLLAMAARLRRLGASFEFHYCTRSPAVTGFRNQLDTVSARGATRLYHDDGSSRWRFDAAAILAAPRPGAQVYVCGPPGFIGHVLSTARAAGWSEPQLSREYFQGADIDLAGEAAFVVRLARRGVSFSVPPGKTVVQVLAENRVRVPVACKQGVCGTCITAVLEGVCDHRDLFLTDEEKARNDQFTPCCSRAFSPELVLDL